MPKEPAINAIDPRKQETSLDAVLADSRYARGMVQECVEELSTVNSGIERQRAGSASAADMDEMLQHNAAAEDKAIQASNTLAQVNEDLVEQIHDRNLLDQQLAVALEREARSRRAALHDELTGLPNRALFADRLEHGLAQASRHGWTLAVMFIDLDGFKCINDAHGHFVGDRVLQHVALRLGQYSRSEDTVCRYGGDEFLLLLMQLDDAGQVASLAEKIGAALSQPFHIEVDGATLHLQLAASIGIALYPRDGDAPAALLAAADQAMYRAKRERSGYAFSDPSHSGPGS